MAKVTSAEEVRCKTTACRGIDRIYTLDCGCVVVTNEVSHMQLPACLAGWQLRCKHEKKCGQAGDPKTHRARQQARRCVCQ